MDPVDEALDLLAAPYATLLRLRAAGAPDDLTAQALGVPVGALPVLTSIAESKLRRLLDPTAPAVGDRAAADPTTKEMPR